MKLQLAWCRHQWTVSGILERWCITW